jgi:hypothetical protein
MFDLSLGRAFERFGPFVDFIKNKKIKESLTLRLKR